MLKLHTHIVIGATRRWGTGSIWHKFYQMVYNKVSQTNDIKIYNYNIYNKYSDNCSYHPSVYH